MRRFWREVRVDDGRVLLDGRPVRTPARATLVLPNDRLAGVIAAEWSAVGDTIDPGTMPMTGLANAATDHVAPDPQAFAAALAKFAEADVLCYGADHPPDLVARQSASWDGPLAWARHRFDIDFIQTTGIVHVAQPPETLARLSRAVASRTVWELAALSPLVTIGGSLVVALMLAQRAIAVDEAFDAAHVDELWQAEKWGEDAAATDLRALRRRDFTNAARFLTLL